MLARDFVYWLQGFFEITKGEGIKDFQLGYKQCEIIQNHLNMVFHHEIDPSMGDKEHQGKLNEIHNWNQVHLEDLVIPPSTSQSIGQGPSHKSTVKYRC